MKFTTGNIFVAVLIIFFLAGCKSQADKDSKNKNGKSNTLFSSLSPSETGVKFTNLINENDSNSFFTYQYFYNGAGVATGDLNNDGLPDIFFGGNDVSCRLYQNKGNLKFEDITEKAGVTTAGWCTGISMVDINNDGLLDIYVCRSSPLKPANLRTNLLFINQGNMTFKESAHEYGLDDPGYSTQAYFFDADNDGDLDMYLVNHGVVFFFKIIDRAMQNADTDPYVSHKFYLNNGNGKFTEDTKHAGLLSHTFGLSAAIADVNNDHYLDIYDANDYLMPDFLHINNHNATFSDQTDQFIKHMSHFSMGSDFADFNNDGLIDLITLDMLPEDNYRHKMLFRPNNYDEYTNKVKRGFRHQRMQNCLQLNNGNGTFSDIALLSGVARSDWSWASLFVDMDNDGWKDLFITTGYLRDAPNLDFSTYREQKMLRDGKEKRTMELLKQMPVTPLQKYAFHNNGDLTFSKMSDAWGFTDKGFSNGAAYADLDNDGDMDLVVNSLMDTAKIYLNHCNDLNKTHYLKVKLVGPEKNKSGIGTEVLVSNGNIKQNQVQMPFRGYESSVDYVLNFGLGNDSLVKSVLVNWPDGKHQALENIKAGQVLTVDHKNAEGKGFDYPFKPVKHDPLFETAENKYNIHFTHTENDFIDYKREPLLPHKFSQGGPSMAAADVNGDGLEDFFVGNAKGASGKLFIQSANGTFKESQSQPWSADKMQEDMGCLFFDADGDKDMDLYVVSGGSEENNYSSYYQDRLYLNDGKGNFSKCNNCLPQITASGSCVAAADFDGDGDLDIFRGSRIIPSKYPMPPESYLLRNDHGKFTNVIKEVAPELQHAGLVNAAIWADVNNDKQPDLVVCGEWMPVMIFENKEGHLSWLNKNPEGKKTSGWWNTITAADMDHDGDIDFIAGNYGWNSKLTASPERPLSIVAKDFDWNGTLDAIISCYTSDGKSYPIYSRDDITDQIRPLKKVLLRYNNYAGKTVEQIIPADSLKNAQRWFAYDFSTTFIENTGGGNFVYHPLPIEAQISPVYGIVADDFNGDGQTDILLAGNSYAESVELGRCDAGTGLLLTGDGKGNFKPMTISQSGFFADKDVKSMVKVKIGHGTGEIILVGNNNDPLQCFEVLKPKSTAVAGK